MLPFDPPRDFVGMMLIVLMLGMQHGFDADHLAAIDGLTRFNARARPRLARLAGVLFSAGHGLIVIAVALGVSLLAQSWRVPHWLDAFGAWTSITLLTLLALLNIAAVLRAPPHETACLAGWRSGVFAALLRAGSPLTVMGVGTLFALSFDTVSQAALFAVTATQFGGWQSALLLALLFIGGMLVTDGINGLWISHLIRRSDHTARVASRVLSLGVSGIGLLVAGLMAAGRTAPTVALWSEVNAFWLGAAVIVIVAVSFAMGQQLARVEPPSVPDGGEPPPGGSLPVAGMPQR